MIKHVNEIFPGDILAKDIYSKSGLLLLRAGAVISQKIKDALRNHKISNAYITSIPN